MEKEHLIRISLKHFDKVKAIMTSQQHMQKLRENNDFVSLRIFFSFFLFVFDFVFCRFSLGNEFGTWGRGGVGVEKAVGNTTPVILQFILVEMSPWPLHIHSSTPCPFRHPTSTPSLTYNTAHQWIFKFHFHFAIWLFPFRNVWYAFSPVVYCLNFMHDVLM